MLYPVQKIRRLNDQEMVVYTGYSDSKDLSQGFGRGAVTVVVAVRGGGGRDWSAYWSSFALTGADNDSMVADWAERTASRGNKVEGTIAVAMFPRQAEEWGYYRD
jgi:hypothetical protein